MTTEVRRTGKAGAGPDGPGAWRRARFELGISAAALVALGWAAGSVGGGGATVLVVVVFSVVALVVVYSLLPAGPGQQRDRRSIWTDGRTAVCSPPSGDDDRT